MIESFEDFLVEDLTSDPFCGIIKNARKIEAHLAGRGIRRRFYTCANWGNFSELGSITRAELKSF